MGEVILYPRCPVCNERCPEGVRAHLHRVHMGTKKTWIHPALEVKPKQKIPAEFYANSETANDYEWRKHEEKLDKQMLRNFRRREVVRRSG